jgi:hypothetical protein
MNDEISPYHDLLAMTFFIEMEKEFYRNIYFNISPLNYKREVTSSLSLEASELYSAITSSIF